MKEAIEIDGSFGEAGGQIVRTSLALSALTGIPLKLFNIRAGRSPPGLKPQHVAGARAVRSICRGKLEGAEEGSRELIYAPGKIYGGKYEFNIGTAGSVTLLAQTVLPLLFAASKKSRVKIIGGTDVPKAPGYDYFEKVFLPALSLFGLNAKCALAQAGYFPRGGGELILEAEPGKPKPVSYWPRESVPKAIISISGLPLGIAMREKKVLLNNGIENVHIRERNALDPGNALLLYRGFVGCSVLGRKGLRAEKVAQSAIDSIEGEGDVDIDHNLADQILAYAALAGKTSFKTSHLTKHTETNMHIIEKFLGKKFSSEGNAVEVG
ncbi:RNA 3'-phosphate cyclase [Candidatus Micrarchaeota archaeon]|nr:RNA 3'-phosphate cyclase [Candidatus Micrarchaeota archaeon]MBD3417630.1 RNA 3'-phosphate cyclase [Candidatus Micrarchaeota archaeon]